MQDRPHFTTPRLADDWFAPTDPGVSAAWLGRRFPMPKQQGSTSTAPERHPQTKIRRARTERRVVLVLLAVFLALALAGVFGPKTSKVTATAGGYQL
jgi:hypothetical protein